MKHGFKLEYKNKNGKSWKLIAWWRDSEREEALKHATNALTSNAKVNPLRSYRLVDQDTGEVVSKKEAV